VAAAKIKAIAHRPVTARWCHSRVRSGRDRRAGLSAGAAFRGMVGTVSDHNLQVSVDDQVFLMEGGEEIGAVQKVARDHLVIYIENAGPFTVTGAQVKSAHNGKVVLEPSELAPDLKAAAEKAHAAETPGL
jgi:hypothetical protein